MDEQDKTIKNNQQKSRDDYQKLGTLISIGMLILAFLTLYFNFLK